MQPNIFLEGNFAPIYTELTLQTPEDFEIKGTIPRELHGSLYRNGPNPAQKVAGNHHWFLGDGMIHSFHFFRGTASYNNAWARTPTFQLERRAGKSLFLGATLGLLANAQLVGKDVFGLLGGLLRQGNADTYTRLISKANTAILAFRDHVYALVESSPPLRLSAASLETEDFENFGSNFIAPFTAHPKVDPQTGYLYAFGYRVFGKPRLEYYVINPSGRLVSRTPIDTPYAAMVHDFAITRNYALLPVFPAVSSLAAIRRGRIAEWQPDKPSILYLLERGGEKGTLRSVEMPLGYVYHYANAYEEAGAIFLDGFSYDKVPLMGTDEEIREELFAGANPGSFTRFRIDLQTGRVEKQDLWQAGFAEFPVIDGRLTGEKYETVYTALRRPECNSTGGIFDCQATFHIHKGKLRSEVTPLPAGHFGGEPVFVPTGKAGQNKGFLLNIIYDSHTDHSYLGIFDAAKPDKRALCEIHVPHRIPYGFHGTWRPGRS
ncbi:MAG: carotenoid oxygenase family protein [Spirochaetota bacterium]